MPFNFMMYDIINLVVIHIACNFQQAAEYLQLCLPPGLLQMFLDCPVSSSLNDFTFLFVIFLSATSICFFVLTSNLYILCIEYMLSNRFGFAFISESGIFFNESISLSSSRNVFMRILFMKRLSEVF